MRRALCIWLTNWPLQRLLLEQPALEGRPVALHQAVHGTRRIVRWSREAQALGLGPDLTVAEAESLAPHADGEEHSAASCLCLRPADPQADREALQRLALWCGQFSPVVGLEQMEWPESLLLDVSGLEHLFGGEVALLEKVTHALASRKLTARLAVADTVGAAWAVAHFSTPRSGGIIVPRGEVSAALGPLPVEGLRLADDVLDRLKQLGLNRIGQLASLPRKELALRLGRSLLQRLDQASGALAEPVPLYAPPATVRVEETFEYPTTRREAIEQALLILTARLSEELRRHGLGALRLECRLRCLEQKSATLAVGLFRPTVSPQRIFSLLQMQLERLRMPAAVTALEIEALLTAVLADGQQEMFAEGLSPSRHDQLAAFVDRLNSRLGPWAVLQIRLVPDAQPELAYRYGPLLQDRRFKPPPGRVERSDLLPRPLRLLPRPQPIVVVALVPDGPPLRFTFAGQEHCVAQAWGPERIETGWWRGRTISRDYYRVATARGHHFWLFRRLCDALWFLHGMFE